MYIDNTSDPTTISEKVFESSPTNQLDSYNQLIDIEEGDISASAPVEHNSGPNIGEKAIDFKLETLTGKDITLSSLKGKKVIINFWATWCPPCKEEMPIMQEFYIQHQKNVEILAINIDPQYNVKEYKDNMGLTFPILLDKDDKINTAYDILSVPTTYVINEQGIITNKHIGAITTLDTFNALMK